MLRVAQGGTLTLHASFRDAAGALTDPTNPRVDILDPLGAVIVNNAAPVHDALGEYHYTHTAAVDALLGDWTIHWTGTIAGADLAADEDFEVVAPGIIVPEDDDLITLAEYQRATNDTAMPNDRANAVSDAIKQASAAIREYLGRLVGVATATQTRSYEYEGTGFLEIDDVSAVTAVAVNGTVQEPGTYRLEPFAGPVYTWIELPQYRQPSPEMGFMQNLDQLWPWFGQTVIMVEVTGTFGWSFVPDTIKRAAIWTVQDWLDEPAGGDLSSESISGFSRSWAFGGAGMTKTALPARAQDILNPFVRGAGGMP